MPQGRKSPNKSHNGSTRAKVERNQFFTFGGSNGVKGLLCRLIDTFRVIEMCQLHGLKMYIDFFTGSLKLFI